jgi:DNA polymerase-4
VVEPLSLDEAYLDVSGHDGAPAALAAAIRQMILQQTRLTCSAGIGPNKLVAKIASDMNKPNGQLEVAPERVDDFMRELPVRKIWGIGSKTEEHLTGRGITTCAELQALSRVELVNLFGRFGLELFDLCRGMDHRPVEPNRPRKSLSTEETFLSDLATLEACLEQLPPLHAELTNDLTEKEENRTIAKAFVKLKFADFTRTTVERSGVEPSLESYEQLLAEAFRRTEKPVRLIGVGVRFSEPVENAQLELW